MRDSTTLGTLAAEGATLWERLDGPWQPVDSPASRRIAGARLEHWCQRSVGGDAELFRRRLSWLGTTPERARPLLGEVRLDAALPRWTSVFAEMMNAVDAGVDGPAGRRPFATLLAPFVGLGVTRLAAADRAVFAPAALDALVDDLGEQLSHLAAPALYLGLATRRKQPGAPTERRFYDALAAELRAGGWWTFFTEYPVLARRLAQTIELWEHNTAALAAAFRSDRVALAQTFGGRVPERIVGLRPSLSDRHDGGQTVVAVELDNGRALFYKPRDLGIEQAWFELLAELDGDEAMCLRVLARPGHGWVEAANWAPCRDGAEVERFYHRAGRLLALLYALEASDCFYENVIACGSHPLLIDVETLMHPALRRTAELSPAEDLADRVVFHSVLRAGLLPAWEAGPDGRMVDISGLGARSGQVTPYLRRRWHDLDSDALGLDHEPILVESTAHLPHLDGVAAHAVDHTGSVLAGFRAMYTTLCARRPQLLGEDGYLAQRFGAQEIRVVFHATRIYGLLLKRLGAPRHFRQGVLRSIETDLLSRFYFAAAFAGREQPWWRPVLAAELQALEQLDVPRFPVRANRRELCWADGSTTADAFAETAIERVSRKLAALSPEDLELQTEMIRASLSIPALAVHREHGADGDAAELDAGAPDPNPRDFVAEALSIAAVLEQHAIVAPDGAATWIAPQQLPGGSHYGLRPLRLDLYNGSAGVALFFAALERTQGTGRRLALAALDPLRRFVAGADAARMAREDYGLGAGTGLGSFCWVLARVAGLLGEPDLLVEARVAAQRITPDWIAADDRFDVMTGAAGAILGLLPLARVDDGTVALEQAVRCGDHLLAHRRPAGRGVGWAATGRPLLTGLSHGAAGIALALLRLADAASEPRFRAAAQEAIAFEDGTFDETHGNWPDFRTDSPRPTFMDAWCHGGPGIGLARAAGLPLHDSPSTRRDIAAALATVVRRGLGTKDGLCCGNLGRAELLILAPARGERPSAADLAAAVVRRARRLGGYGTSGRPGQGFFDPSFFQGLAGIGYQLLRIAQPAQLPSVLVWE